MYVARSNLGNHSLTYFGHQKVNSQNIGLVLAINLTNVLSVAGSIGEDGKPKRIRPTDLQRATGIARSTLRPLLKDAGREANPDLKTLCKIADEVGIPVGFLLIAPQQWATLMQAISDMPTMLAAADALETKRRIHEPLDAEKVLNHAGVHPIMPPRGEAQGGTSARLDDLKLKNAQTTRSAAIVAALLQSAAQTPEARKQLTALAASLANRGVVNNGRSNQVKP
jgi:transcriptional regulator with XRE-family HTH domain